MQELETKANINISFKSYYLYARVFLLLLLSAIILFYYYPRASNNLLSTSQTIEETKIVIERGDTLRSVLSKFSMSEQEINQVIEITASVYDFRKIQIGQVLRVYYILEDDQKILQSISLKLNNDKKIEIYTIRWTIPAQDPKSWINLRLEIPYQGETLNPETFDEANEIIARIKATI
jgi:hypothetical protein